MQINPGGRLDIKDVIGRDNEIARYWSVLERQGLVRSTKTSKPSTPRQSSLARSTRPSTIP